MKGEGSISFPYICDILGHVSIHTTDIYARTDAKMKREALGKHISPFPLRVVLNNRT